MLTPNLVHLRATACPYYPQEGIQQIVIYGRTEKDTAKPTSEEEERKLRENAIRCVVVEFKESPDTRCTELLKKLQQQLGDPVGKPLQQQLDDPDENMGPYIFSRDNLKWLAEAGRSDFSRRIRGVKWLGEGYEHLERLPPPCHRTVPRRSTFVMACCIYDKPGTMYRILSSLRTPKAQALPPDACDLNIDYMRTEDLRIGEYYSFELYGTYTTSPQPASQRTPEENVCGVVFYADFSQNSGLIELVKNAMTSQSRLRLKEVQEGELQEHWRKVYEISGTDNRLLRKDFRGYRKNAHKIERDLPSVRQCPISRIVGCPIPLPRKKKFNDQPGGSRARIGVLLHDVPGALISSLDLLGKLSERSAVRQET